MKLTRPGKLYFLFGFVASSVFFIAAGVFVANSSSASADSPQVLNVQDSPQGYRIVSPMIPEDLNFAGERVPLEKYDIRERMEREFIVNSYWHSFTILAIKRSARFFPVIEPILKEYGIPDDFKYLAVIESGLANVVSSAGASGIWQLMKDPAESFGLEVNSEVDERYHIEKATRAACRYLLMAHSKFNNWTLSAASYNMGMSGIERQLERQYTRDYYELHLNEETSRYMARILSLKEIMNNPESYGFEIEQNELYSPLQFYEIEEASPIKDLPDFARKKGISYKTLKLFNPWLRDNKITGRAGRVYSFKVPVKTDP